MAHFGKLAHFDLCASQAHWHKMKIKIKNMSLQSSLSTEIDLLDDSVEEKQPRKTSY